MVKIDLELYNWSFITDLSILNTCLLPYPYDTIEFYFQKHSYAKNKKRDMNIVLSISI